MIEGLIVIWVFAIGAGIALWRRSPQRLPEAFRIAGNNVKMLAPRILLAMLGAAFYATLLPEEQIVRWIGGESGWTGIAIAAAIGAVMPGGPIVSFPIAIAVAQAGAGMPQVVAFLTGWAAIAFHRTMTWDLVMLGPGFTRIRFLVSLPLPFIAGGLAWMLQ